MRVKTITTANLKNPNYNERHQIYVGTHTGSFKKIDVFADDPYKQINIQTLSILNKNSRITALDWGYQNEIIIGRSDKYVQIYNVTDDEFTSTVETADEAVVGVARYDGNVIAGLARGTVQIFQEPQEFLETGDHLSRIRQCKQNMKLIATCGKGRKNNLKLWDLATKTKIFTSKNVPNDYLQLEVPVWDSDMAFLDTHCLATSSRYGYVRVYDTRKQRRPVLEYKNSREQDVYGCISAQGNVLYVGSASGIVRAFDTRKMKTVLHTYKGFTGSVSDIAIDSMGKYVFTACLDRFIRVHCTQTTALQYQCYVKSKATRILQRDYEDNTELSNCAMQDESSTEVSNEPEDNKIDKQSKCDPGSDSEYEEIFQSMQTVTEEEKKQQCQKRRTKGSRENISKKKK